MRISLIYTGMDKNPVTGEVHLEMRDEITGTIVQIPATTEMIGYCSRAFSQMASYADQLWLEMTANDIRRSAENNRATVDPVGVDVYKVGPVVAEGGMHENRRTSSDQFDGGSKTPHVGVAECCDGTCACGSPDEQREGQVSINDGA